MQPATVPARSSLAAVSLAAALLATAPGPRRGLRQHRLLRRGRDHGLRPGRLLHRGAADEGVRGARLRVARDPVALRDEGAPGALHRRPGQICAAVRGLLRRGSGRRTGSRSTSTPTPGRSSTASFISATSKGFARGVRVPSGGVSGEGRGQLAGDQGAAGAGVGQLTRRARGAASSSSAEVLLDGREVEDLLGVDVGVARSVLARSPRVAVDGAAAGATEGDALAPLAEEIPFDEGGPDRRSVSGSEGPSCRRCRSAGTPGRPPRSGPATSARRRGGRFPLP